MSYTKAIVCLANSRKLNGRCVAGREVDGNCFGSWVRPVSSAEKGELGAQRYYEGYKDPQLLDIIQVPLLEPRPAGYQTENHLIDGRRWRRSGSVTVEELVPAIEKITGPLWVNGESTTNGQNDKITREVAAGFPNSLALVQPEGLVMRIDTEGADFGNPRRRVRGHFSLNGQDYVLGVTDPIFEREFRAQADGWSRELKNPILCISLSEIFEKQNACYKLIAGVIES